MCVCIRVYVCVREGERESEMGKLEPGASGKRHKTQSHPRSPHAAEAAPRFLLDPWGAGCGDHQQKWLSRNLGLQARPWDIGEIVSPLRALCYHMYNGN